MRTAGSIFSSTRRTRPFLRTISIVGLSDNSPKGGGLLSVLFPESAPLGDGALFGTRTSFGAPVAGLDAAGLFASGRLATWVSVGGSFWGSVGATAPPPVSGFTATFG